METEYKLVWEIKFYSSLTLGAFPYIYGFYLKLVVVVQSFGHVRFLWPHGLQPAWLPYPLPSPGACSNSGSLNQWCHPTILSSVIPFSSYLQSHLKIFQTIKILRLQYLFILKMRRGRSGKNSQRKKKSWGLNSSPFFVRWSQCRGSGFDPWWGN